LSFEAELAIVGPLSLQISPSWIFGSPTENVDQSGWAIAGDIGVYFEGKALRGFWLKGHVGYESFTATLTYPGTTDVKGSGAVSSMILGGMLGNTTVFGRDGGFSLSGGIGIGVATADPVTIVADPNRAGLSPVGITFYDKADSIKILGTFGVGVTF